MVTQDEETGRWRLNVLHLMEEHRVEKAGHSSLALDALRRCATTGTTHDEATDTLILDYWVNDATATGFSGELRPQSAGTVSKHSRCC